MSLMSDLSAHLERRVYRGVCRWTPFFLNGHRIAGLAAASHWRLESRSFSMFATTAVAPLSMIARPANDTRFTFQFSKFIASPTRSQPGGSPSSVPPSTSPQTRRIDRPVTSQGWRTTRCRPLLPPQRTLSMQGGTQEYVKNGIPGQNAPPAPGIASASSKIHHLPV